MNVLDEAARLLIADAHIVEQAGLPERAALWLEVAARLQEYARMQRLDEEVTNPYGLRLVSP